MYLEDDNMEAASGKRKQIVSVLQKDDVADNVTLNDGEVLDVLPLRNMVLFPNVLVPIAVGRPKSVELVNAAYKQEKLIAVFCQKEKDTQEPQGNDLYSLGVAARVVQTIEMQNGTLMVILEGLTRIEATEFISSDKQENVSTKHGASSEQGDVSATEQENASSTKHETTKQNDGLSTGNHPGLRAKVRQLPEEFPSTDDKEFIAIVSSVKEQAQAILNASENMPAEAGITLRSINNPPTLVNYVCTNFDIKIEDKQQLLQDNSIGERAIHLLAMLNKEMQVLQMQEDIKSKTKEELDKQQREFYLHQQMETIQKELGDTGAQVLQDMKAKADTKKWTPATRSFFDNELRKLQNTPTHSPEYTTQQNYLETLLALPWGEYTEDNYDIANAKKVLDTNHYGMEKVKERIVEYLAVQRQLSLRTEKEKTEHPVTAPILCLYGPPGVGKTSLGKSIATALGRKYARISLGGLHDEAEIRGHRRTYLGAMPGRIIENIRKVQSSNPVFVLDEIDKIGTVGINGGDPTSALLEVLDPEQNNTFHDNYLDVDYDLSKVLFIATANTLDTIPRPLLDRMELIEMSGYLQEEKEEIARKHLIPKELANHALKPSQLRIRKDIIAHIIDDYTRESGVRNFERQIATICRKIDTKIALGESYTISLTREDLIAYLGQPRYMRDTWETNKYIGVVTGLAWTQVGGEILFIEVSLAPSKTPTLTLTGNLGDVMKESATIALGYIKAHAKQLGIAQKAIDTQSVHVHVPEGAIPKDGPSAGITMTTAMVSAYTHRKVRPRIAMTGEMTLRGKVLPIGGVKEKILAAKRAGITDLVLCEDNRKDVAEIPERYLQGLHFHYVHDIQEVIDYALL